MKPKPALISNLATEIMWSKKWSRPRASVLKFCHQPQLMQQVLLFASRAVDMTLMSVKVAAFLSFSIIKLFFLNRLLGMPKKSSCLSLSALAVSLLWGNLIAIICNPYPFICCYLLVCSCMKSTLLERFDLQYI